MNSSLYIGATGMKGLAEGMSVTTNNLANISTIGFKQQNALFSDIFYQTQANMGDWWNAQDGSLVAIGQVGMGVQVEAVRTIFTQGDIQSTNSLTDLAISGKGFFQVTDGQTNYYTRAGDFNSDSEGVWRTPSGLALTGYELDANGNRGELKPVQVDRFSTMEPRATSSVSLALNLNLNDDKSVDADNPFFAMLGKYNATNKKPLAAEDYGSSQALTVYDAEGNAHKLTAYFDSAPPRNGSRNVEFVVARDELNPVDSDGNPIPVSMGDGLLMSGVLEFDAAGHLANVSAFTPSVAGSQNLSDWTPADMEGGNPVLDLDGTPIAMNFGLSAAEGWENAPASAAEVGSNASSLPRLGENALSAEYPTTAFKTTTMTNSYSQDGYAEGLLSNISVDNNGRIVGQFSNGENMDLWEIPVARFRSEDGLRREGGNLYTAAEEAGEMTLGMAGTENYGEIRSYNIEGSNVDMAQEMVNMIVNQRGFQSNSKVVTTADQLLQKAIELKR